MNIVSYFNFSENMICAEKCQKCLARTKCKTYCFSQKIIMSLSMDTRKKNVISLLIIIHKKSTMLLLFLREMLCPYLLSFTTKYHVTTYS